MERGEYMTIKEIKFSERIAVQLVILSKEWDQENSCHGYRRNSPDDLKDKRIFVATDGDLICGYLFGHSATTEKDASIYKAGTAYFEIDELYVKPQYRNCGIGKKLFRHAEKAVSPDVDMIMLTAAAKNSRAILHFYIDELGMDFWSARLFKKIR